MALRRLVAGRALDFGIGLVLFCSYLVIILALILVLLWTCFGIILALFLV